MPRIDVRALPDVLSFASLPKSVLHSFLSVARQVFPLVLLRPTRAGCVNCSFESPFTICSRVVSRRATSHLYCTFRKTLTLSYQLQQAAEENAEFRREALAALTVANFVLETLSA